MVNDHSSSERMLCPFCKSNNLKILNKDLASLIKCPNCRIIINNNHQRLKYNDDYFTKQYKEQYGKTYIEDYDHIYLISCNRIEKIFKYIKPKVNNDELNLIDIGSAMGFFLKAAYDNGIKNLQGIEISKYAAKYCIENFKINVINSSFEDTRLNNKFDIITAWYFIEHCHHPLNIIEKIFNSLKQGGIFAFSTPSIFGPQYLFKRKEWIKSHPVDHRVDFSPSGIKKILNRAGFSGIKTYPGGIHPERIISEGSVLHKPFKKIYTSFSGKFSFSDTMEVYAVK